MFDICMPVPVAGSPVDTEAAALVSLHREVLETIRLTITSGAHPGCASCHELAGVLDRYLIG